MRTDRKNRKIIRLAIATICMVLLEALIVSLPFLDKWESGAAISGAVQITTADNLQEFLDSGTDAEYVFISGKISVEDPVVSMDEEYLFLTVQTETETGTASMVFFSHGTVPAYSAAWETGSTDAQACGSVSINGVEVTIESYASRFVTLVDVAESSGGAMVYCYGVPSGDTGTFFASVSDGELTNAAFFAGAEMEDAVQAVKDAVPAAIPPVARLCAMAVLGVYVLFVSASTAPRKEASL